MRGRTSISSLEGMLRGSAVPSGVRLSAPSASRVAGLLALDLKGEPDLSLNLRPHVEDRPTGSESDQSSASSARAFGLGPRRSARHAALFSLAIFVFLVAALLHAALRSGSLAAPAFVLPGHFEATFEESAMRKNPKSFAVAAAAALSIGAGAAAQDAVQWRVEDGGNGHWYQGVVSDGIRWSEARSWCLASGGDLTCYADESESDFVYQNIASNAQLWRNRIGPWIGLVQDPAGDEPAGGWGWCDGSRLSFDEWNPYGFYGQENPVDTAQCTESDFGGYYFWTVPLPPTAVPLNSWSSYQDTHNSACHWEPHRSFIIEWSADCNSDGIVDFGQIRAGELEDANANNVPDCCEAGIPCACSADITGNGNVDAADLAAVLSAWGGTPTGKANADVNGDGSVDAADLAAVLSSWGPCP